MMVECVQLTRAGFSPLRSPRLTPGSECQRVYKAHRSRKLLLTMMSCSSFWYSTNRHWWQCRAASFSFGAHWLLCFAEAAMGSSVLQTPLQSVDLMCSLIVLQSNVALLYSKTQWTPCTCPFPAISCTESTTPQVFSFLAANVKFDSLCLVAKPSCKVLVSQVVSQKIFC